MRVLAKPAPLGCYVRPDPKVSPRPKNPAPSRSARLAAVLDDDEVQYAAVDSRVDVGASDVDDDHVGDGDKSGMDNVAVDVEVVSDEPDMPRKRTQHDNADIAIYPFGRCQDRHAVCCCQDRDGA